MTNDELFAKIFLFNLEQEIGAITRMNFVTIFPTFITELQSQNFKGIKEVLDYLLANKKIVIGIYNLMLKLFLKQGIDLNNLK